MELFFKVICLLEPVGIDPEALGNCGIEHDVCAGDAVCRADHSELELVACKGERRCSVSVGGISCERRQDAYAELHDFLFNTCVRGVGLDSFEDTLKLIAEEDRDNSRRCFVCAEAVVVACGRDGDAQKILIVIDRFDNGTQEQQELCVFIRSFARCEKVYARIGRDGPVVMLARAVDVCKRLFVQQADKPVLLGDPFHYLHGELVVVGRDVGGGIDRCKLVLCGCDLVMLCFGEDTKLPQLFVEVRHIRLDTRLDDSEIVVVKLLPLWRLCSEKSSACIDKVLALIVKLLGAKEVLLLGPD